MSDLRIFSYLPNPRIWKATIAARLCGLDVEIRGASPKELESWLWDFDARPLSMGDEGAARDVRIGQTGFKGVRLRKTDAFLEAHPFGTVPAAFSPDGRVGIFESNSILRAVGRLGERRLALYGRDAYEASRIDSFLDASLVFARDAQTYLLALLGGSSVRESHARAREALATYLSGISRALVPAREFLVGTGLSLADICFVAEIGLFWNERARTRALEAEGLEPILDEAWTNAAFARSVAHFARLREHPAFAPDVQPYLAKIDRAAAQSGA
jgi:elongation factor 1-gamma